MTPQKAKELLPIIQAFAEGKKIQIRAHRGNEDWKDISDTRFWDDEEYRIKPEEEMCKGCGRPISACVEDKDYKFVNNQSGGYLQKTPSHPDIMRMWWRHKQEGGGWSRVESYGSDKKYVLRIWRSKLSLSEWDRVTAEELARDFEYSECPPQE